MADRESINRVKIEEFRASRVPINLNTDIFQGDLLAWDASARIAVPLTSASAGSFLGMSEGKNPIDTVGVLTSDTRVRRINVIQEGLVELIIDETVVLKPLDILTLGTTSVQHVKKTGANAGNQVGVVAVENDYDSASGQTVTGGELILVRLRVVSTLKMSF